MSFDNDQYTFVVPACSYPLAEISVTLVQYFYPDIKILMSFDKNYLTNERRDFFSKFLNLEIVPDEFLLGHARQLNRIINNYVKTKYFIALDDDSFMMGPGILELIDGFFNENDGAINLDSCKPSRKLSQRALPCFCIFKTDVFKKYNMTFEATHLYPEYQFYYDVGSFVLFDIYKYQIPVVILNDATNHYIQHVWYISGLYEYLNKEAFRDHDFNIIPQLSTENFYFSKISVEHKDEFSPKKVLENHLLGKISQINHYSQIAQNIASKNLLYPDNYQSLFEVTDSFKKQNKILTYEKITNGYFKSLNWRKCNIGWLITSNKPKKDMSFSRIKRVPSSRMKSTPFLKI